MIGNGDGRIVMTSPDHYEVCYTINPWMKPDVWARNAAAAKGTARAQWKRLFASLQESGLTVEVAPAEPGLPDMVFPANSAIVLDGYALLARFRHGERSGEEPVFRRYFDGLVRRGLLAGVEALPRGVVQEGAGDCIWDASRGLFWAGYGPRSGASSPAEIAAFFGQPAIGLELATEHFYHLDTCFCALPGGEILFYPQAFTKRALSVLEEIVPAGRRIAATAEEAAAFSLNAVAAGLDLIMAPPPERLRAILEERGYRCRDVDLSSFMLSGGAAYCMTLRLDLTAKPEAPAVREGEPICSPRNLSARSY